jgi:hypothetical protein
MVDHGGDVDQNRRPVAGDFLEHDLSGTAFREKHRGGAYRKRKQKIGPSRVTEEQLGHGERDVGLGVTDDVPGVALGGIGERGVGLNHGLGMAGGAAGEKPNRGIVSV